MPLIRMKYKKYPHFVEVMSKSHLVYNDTLSHIEKMEKQGKLFVIRPECKLPVKLVEKNPKKLRMAYEIGRQSAYKHLDEIKEFLCLKQGANSN